MNWVTGYNSWKQSRLCKKCSCCGNNIEKQYKQELSKK